MGGLVTLVVGIALLMRVLQSSCVVVGTSNVKTKSIVRTRTFDFTELMSVEVVTGTTGLNGHGRQFLVFNSVSGQRARFTELNCAPSKDAQLSLVQRAAHCINERIPNSHTQPERQ